MKVLKNYMLFCLMSMGIIIGFINPENYTYAEVPFLDSRPSGEDEKKYGQNEEDVQSTIDEIAGANQDEMILDTEGLTVFHKQGENFVGIIAGLMWGFCLITIVLAGFKIATSEGNKQVVVQAKMQIIFAGIGIGISTLTYVIILFFQEVLG